MLLLYVYGKAGTVGSKFAKDVESQTVQLGKVTRNEIKINGYFGGRGLLSSSEEYQRFGYYYVVTIAWLLYVSQQVLFTRDKLCAIATKISKKKNPV